MKSQPVLDVVQQAIRIAWAHDAARADLTPAAAFWRYLCLERGHPVYWLRQPWQPHTDTPAPPHEPQ